MSNEIKKKLEELSFRHAYQMLIKGPGLNYLTVDFYGLIFSILVNL